MRIIGIDIGGTKCAVVLGGIDDEGNISIIDKIIYQTMEHLGPGKMIDQLMKGTQSLFSKTGTKDIIGIGISCGGPLNSAQGIILSPPNLPGWDAVRIVDLFSEKFKVPTSLQNDANAGALAEWKFGAGKGFQNLIFLTFGTGIGAGLILNGKLYPGTNDMAGEIGHIRMENTGPLGYGKAGSFEGFCSGAGIAQMAKIKAIEKLDKGEKVLFCKDARHIDSITALTVAEAAYNGDLAAQEIYEVAGAYLGKGVSMLIDILNPELIIIGGIFAQASPLLIPAMKKTIRAEALTISRNVCKIVPAALEEKIGDYASLSIAANNL